MSRHLLILIAVINVLTGVQMFVMPAYFYETVPGVSMLGPFNVHFIRDAGLSYTAAGLLQAWGWRRGVYTWSVAGGLWPVFHALFHLQMWIARGIPVDLVAAVNLFGIQLPAWVAFLAAWQLNKRQGASRA